MLIRLLRTAHIINTMNLESKNSEESIVKPGWEKFVPGGVFDASIPLDVHLQDADVNYVELSLGDGRPFAFVFFDRGSRFVYVLGRTGQVCTFNQPFSIGRKSLQYYPEFFGDTEKSVSEEHCIISVSGSQESPDGTGPYPIVKIENKSPQGNGTFCRVFQNPKPPSSRKPTA